MALTFPRLAWWGLAVLALHNAEEALTIPSWLASRLPELEARFGIRPLAADTGQLYAGLVIVTLVPAVWVALVHRSRPRSAGAYSVLVLYGIFFANAFVPHLLGALLFGGYAPGALTAGLLVVPFSIWLAYRAVADGYATKRGVALALLLAVALYVPALAALMSRPVHAGVKDALHPDLSSTSRRGSMQDRSRSIVFGTVLALVAGAAVAQDRHDGDDRGRGQRVQLGPRPFYLVEGMDEGRLKDRLMRCQNGPFFRTDFSIGHRGAALQFPEHTQESYQAAVVAGAGIVECDVTFTKDGELVCRHSECDLHTTTNIVATPLNAKCTVPWSGPNSNPKCCTSDLTLVEYRTLRGKMDASVPSATTAEGYLGGTASWRTDLYTGRGTLMTVRESALRNERNGVKHTPELKGGDPVRIAQVFGGQAQYAQKLVDVLRAARVDPRDVWLQSFNKEDVLYWVRNAPDFGRQAVYLDSVDPTAVPPVPPQTLDQLRELRAQGVRYFAPPIPALLAVDADNRVVPSQYALDIRSQGFKIITWTLERSDLRRGASRAGFYYSFDPEGRAIKKDGDVYKALDALAQRVKIVGIFSDWPATVTYYANCMGLDSSSGHKVTPPAISR